MMKSKTPDTQQQAGLRKGYLLGVIPCTLIGSGLALYTVKLTFNAAKNGLDSAGGCSFNNWIGCNSVFATRYATMLGMPTGWWGFLLYVGIALAVTFAALSKNKARAISTMAAVLIFALAAVLFSFYKAYHLVVLKTICPFCIGMYIMNIAIAVLLVRALRLTDDEVGRFLGQYFKSVVGRASSLTFAPQPVLFSALAISLFSLGYIGLEKYQQVQQQSAMIKSRLASHFAQQPVTMDIDTSAAAWGNRNSKITIVEFSDFECPSCSRAANRFRDIIKDYQHEVQFFFLNFPLDKAINPNLSRQMHVNAGLAARAGVCAQQRGDFWSFHDDLFRQQKQLSRELVIDLAKRRGWDVAEFESCLDDEATLHQVRQEIANGQIAGVRGTPTFFINGRVVKSWNIADLIHSIIREEHQRTLQHNGSNALAAHTR